MSRFCSDRPKVICLIFIRDIFDEQQDENVILVLAGIHASAQFIATGPKRGIKFGFFQGHFLYYFLTFFFNMQLPLAA